MTGYTLLDPSTEGGGKVDATDTSRNQEAVQESLRIKPFCLVSTLIQLSNVNIDAACLSSRLTPRCCNRSETTHVLLVFDI